MNENDIKIPWQILSDCVQHLGAPAFTARLIDLLTGPLSVMQCMVFTYDTTGNMKCRLSLNFQSMDIAVPLAGAYISDGFRNDPNLAAIRDKSCDQLTIRLSDVIDRLSEPYREKYFNRPGIVDKVSHIRSSGNLTYYINLYRGQEAGPIDRADLLTDDGFMKFLSTVLIRHFETSDPLSSCGPLSFLSERERQICDGILKGQKAEQIAHSTGLSPHTVTTYRKRAYQKLGISSRGELFTLCT